MGCDTCLGIWRRKGNAEPAFAGVWRWVLLVRGGEVQAGTVPDRRLEENVVRYILTPLVQRGPGWPHWGVGPCQLGMEGMLAVGDASGGQQTGSLWEVQPSHSRLLLSHICKVTHGEVSVAPGPGKGAHTAGDSMEHTLAATRGALGLMGQLQRWAECAGSSRGAGKCPSPVSRPGHPLRRGPRGSTGLRGGLHQGPLPALPTAPGTLLCPSRC